MDTKIMNINTLPDITLSSTPARQDSFSQLVCVERWNETADVVSFRFQAGEPMKFDYKPGQFMTLVLDINGEQACRSYTLSSTPSRPYSLILTIKRVNGGLVSNYLIDHLQPGQTVRVLPPTGQFNLFDIPAKKYLFLSAGCGITPMYSMSRYLTDSQMNADIAFVHSARTQADIIFKTSLETMATRHRDFKLRYIVEDVTADTAWHPEAVLHDIGRLSADNLRALVPDFAERTVFLCGPEPYMQAVKTILAELNFDMTQLYHESFATAVKEAQSRVKQAEMQTEAPVSGSNSFILSIGDKKRALMAEQTLLEGIEAEGLPIIAACRSGVCGACKCQVLEGETESSSSMTLTPTEIEAGYVLACSTKLKSDVTLSLT
ncbi:hybrid-cluster NAD(P)-dependent oxidoreductase [Shewanella xiamenensis]|uniref:hybrid-cluster NAD(P)-dependent oxidoreductase n=1 Tax=Shewanella xiamenensis TaxID=332186 RepID=UPI00217E83C6|nr:hybrid-cluster NAD(P)-dependent oxidoreductase [Shewanella xiamenensis]MCT8870151.1 hybrid-cluster NAD(P)-dependent oxidoreductase [Shewanella xiamenensis]UWH41020.1 hybrid-cluster NAD(P)-dependent oxidoreductase [Shewanella xiamenensis]